MLLLPFIACQMVPNDLMQALNGLSPTYGQQYAQLFVVAGFPDATALKTLRETDALTVPVGVRRAVIAKFQSEGREPLCRVNV